MNKTFALAFLLFTAVHLQASGVDVVRTQFEAFYSASGADPSTPRMQRALHELESVTRQITGPTWMRSDGSWMDIDYSGSPAGYWGPWDHTRRLIVLAKAYRTPGQGLYRDPALRAQIDAALAYTKTFYGITIIPTGNWWFWTIGIPIDLGPTLVLMQGEVDPQTHEDLVRAMRFRIGSSPTGRGLVGPVPTGENLVWSSFTHLCLGLLDDDAGRLAAVRDAMNSVTKPSAAEGIKRDRSFHQHGAQLYTGGYGGSFANDVARYALITGGTSYGLQADSLASFSDYLADGIAWTLYGNYFDVSVISREVARETTSGFNGIAALLQASQFESPRGAEIRSAAAKMLASWTGAIPSELSALAAKLESARAVPAWPAGHRHYFASDYTVHRRDGWFASVKMFSTRTKSGERTNNENVRGSRQSDGRFYLVQRGDEYFGRDIWPALDWTRLPGTTVEQKADTASDEYGYGTRSFAGGTGDGRNGVSAMELAPLDSDLTARKSWFFFDDAIVFLTTSITSPTTNRVETTRQSVAAPECVIAAHAPRRLGAARRRRLLVPGAGRSERRPRDTQRHVGVPRRLAGHDRAHETVRHALARSRERAGERDRGVRDRAEHDRDLDGAVDGFAAAVDPGEQRHRVRGARPTHRRGGHHLLACGLDRRLSVECRGGRLRDHDGQEQHARRRCRSERKRDRLVPVDHSRRVENDQRAVVAHLALDRADHSAEER